MSRQKKLTPIQCKAVKLLAAVCGYNTSRISELLFPFMDDAKTVTVGALQKRILRIQDEVRSATISETMAGTFLLHKISLKYGNNSDYLMFIVEVYTGWINAIVLPKVRPLDITTALSRMLKEIEKVYQVRLKVKQILLLTFNKKVMKKRDDTADTTKEQQYVETATVIRVPVTKLITDLKVILDPKGKKKIEITTKSVNIDSDDIFELEDEYSRKQLNKNISGILKRYNHIDREKHKFPRTKEKVTPAKRLSEFQLNIWKKNHQTLKNVD
jgi:hypothetical protein